MFRATARGRVGVATSRRRALAACCAAVAVAVLGALAPTPARAEDQGYVSVAGVVGLDEGQAFSTVWEAAAAVAACDADAQAADPSGVALVVHGTVVLDAQNAADGTFELSYPVDGATYAVVGAEEGACLRLVDSSGAGRAPVLSHAGGSLVVSGLAVSGPVGLAARDDLEVDACRFDASVSCFACGSINVAGNVFAASRPASSSALCATLLDASSSLSFAGNQVSGYASGLAVSALQGGDGGVALSITSNAFSLASDAVDPSAAVACVASLTGGPWAPSSVVCGGNAVDGAGAVFVLGLTCAVSVWADGASRVEGVATDDLSAQAIVSLFELADLEGAVHDGCAAVALPPTCTNEHLRARVAEASSTLGFNGDSDAVPAAATVTVSYDGNGATTGTAPETVVLEVGESVSIAHMGSLVCPGFLFEGWNTAADGSGAFYAAGQVISLAESTVLYAQWVPNGTVGTVAVAEQQSAGEGLAA